MFVYIYNFFERRRAAARALFGLTLVLFIALGSRIKFSEDIASMLPDSKALRTMNDVLSHTQAGEKVVFLISFKDTAFTDRDSLIALSNVYFSGLSQRCGEWIDTINLQAGSGMEESLATTLTEHLPLFLTEADYKKLDSLTQPERIRSTLASNKKVLLSPASVVYKTVIATDPIGVSPLVWSKLSALQFDPDYELYEGYIFSKNGQRLTAFLKPKFPASNTGANSKAFAAISAYTDSFTVARPQLSLTYFGSPAVAAGNAAQMRTDSIVTLSVTIVLLIALTFYYFRKKRTPLLLLLPVLYGAAFGLAVVYLVQGSISIIALGAGAIVMGIAIDYAVHFLSHARHASLRQTVQDLQAPLTIGSFTTIAAFASLRFVHLPVLRDLGLFAAVALIGAALCTLVFLPHFPLGGQADDSPPCTTIFDRIAGYEPAKNKYLLWAIVLITPLMAWQSFRVGFDNDLMHLNYLSPRLKAAEKEVGKASSYALSSVFAMGEGATEDDALVQLGAAGPAIDSLQKAGLLRNAMSPSLLIPSAGEQRRRAARWQAFWSDARRKQVLQAVHNAAMADGFSANAFAAFEISISRTPELLDTAAFSGLKALFPGGFSVDERGSHYIIAILKPAPGKRSAVMEALNRTRGIIVTDRQEGASQMVRLLNADFQSIALYSSLIVFFALLIAYGRIELAIISFLPMAISWVWILGLMAMLGIRFNIVNIILSTLIFGLGDDYSIFTLDGLIERYRYKRDGTPGVRAAVYVSVATVLIGLGTLLLAKHPALRSIAAISVMGMLCVLIISQTLQPALFGWLIQRRADKGFLPLTGWSLLKSVFAFLWFISCSFVVTLTGIVLTTLRPFGRKRSKLALHHLIRAANWSLVHTMANVRKRIVNRDLADFSKPAVYVANHTSFLDIIYLTSLHPKLVLLTNKWVYRSPVFGAVVRMADYYPVADGAEASLQPLRQLVNDGYGIIVFPEGTRSKTDKVGRFHKGAFFIAEKLGLPVVPIVLHGVQYTMQKGDWMLKDGQMNLFFERWSDRPDGALPTATGEAGKPAYSIQAKAAGQWYRENLARIKVEIETPTYFREQLLRCYTYKGPVLEWYCRIKTAIENNYETFHRLLPREGVIYDLGCGYGFASYMLHWSAPARTLRGVDYDEDKIATAQAVHLRDGRIYFEAADLRNYPLPPCDAVLITDVLHYMLPDEQDALLARILSALQPGGILIIRDGAVELKDRQKTTAMTEKWSTQLVRFNKTTNALHFLSRKKIEAFAAANGLTCEVLDESGRTSNLIFVLRKPPLAPGNASQPQ